MEPIYCVKCKQKTPNENLKLAKTKNHRPLIRATCNDCGSGKIKFLSKSEVQEGQAGSGILGNLLKLPGGKIPILSDIPLLGMLF